MTELLTSAQMRAIEQACIDSGESNGLELMERAGNGVVDAILDTWPEMANAPRRALVLCGPGNNGGDGFVIARLLAERGWSVSCRLLGDPARMPKDARSNFDRWLKLGQVEPLSGTEPGKEAAGRSPDIVVDALFGTGLTRQMPDKVNATLQDFALTWPDSRWVAVDAPSGLCMDSGRILAPRSGASLARPQDLTVSFHRAKLGHVLAEGPLWCGRVQVVDIGLGGNSVDSARLTTPARAELDKAADGGLNHKYNHGHSLILSGGSGRTGAARLAARAALRVGAGLVTLAVPESAMTECAAQLTAVMLTKCQTASELGRVLEDHRLNALCLGPGLGVGQATCRLVATALDSQRACVLDADALTSFALDTTRLLDRLHRNAVLTPHAGEFERLFPDISERLRAPAAKGPAYSRLDAARDAAVLAGCVVLLKGPDTVIASPDGALRVNAASGVRAAPWLATAGSGDVLAGVITGLLARGMSPLEAAETGAWLHVEAARSYGCGLIAEDLPDELPKVFKSLGL